MISRTAFSQLRHSALILAAALAGLAITFLVPTALVFSLPTSAKPGQIWGTLLGATAWLLMTIAYRPTVRFYGLRSPWAATLPVAAVFYMAATVWSAVKYWSGRGGEWKGRTQDGNRSCIGD